MKASSRTRNAVLNILSSLGGQLLITLLKFVTRTVFIQTLGKSYLGINGLFSDVLTMLSLTELGLDMAINYRLYKPLAEKDEHRVRVLMKFYKLAYRVIGFLILGIGLCLIPVLPHMIRDYDRLEILGINAVLIYILFLLQSVTTYLFFAYRSAVMKADQKKYILDIADYGITIAVNVTQILVLVFTQNFVIYTATVIVFNLFRNALNAVIAKHYYPNIFIKEKDSLSKEEIISLFKDCGAIFVYKINNVVLKATDNMVLSKFMGLAIVGMYSNYLLFYTTARAFLHKINFAVKSSMGNLFATSEVEKKYKFFQIMNYITILLYGTAAVGIAVCANELIHVWVSDDYVIAQPFPILIGLEILFSGMRNNLGQIRNVSGAFRQAWMRPIVGAVLNLIISVILVQYWGIYGVIAGTLISTILTNFLVDPRIIHKYSFDNYRPVSEYYKKNLMYIGILFLIGALDLWICTHFLTGLGWLSVIIHVIIVLITVPGGLILIYWKSHECRYVRQMVTRILGRFKKKGRSSK